MSKRFTATEKWDDPWFCSLSIAERLFWEFLCDKCNHAGIWKINWPLVYFYFGESFKPEMERFKGRIEVVSGEKWFLKKFIEFQYGELDPINRVHLSVINELKKEGVYKPLISPSQGAKDKDKDSSIEASLDLKEREPLGFAEFWIAYPKRRSRGQALKAWRKLKPSMEQVSRILAAIDRAKMSADWAKDGGKYIPHPATWLNAEGWTDEHQANGVISEVIG